MKQKMKEYAFGVMLTALSYLMYVVSAVFN